MGAWQGKCMLVPSGSGDLKHLFAIIVNPIIVPHTSSKPKVIYVNFTSVRSGIPYDDACVVQAGEHPFIEHESYVNYRGARIDEVDHITDMIARGVFIEKEPCSQELLHKMIQGALNSNRISREIKDILYSLN